MARSAVLAGRVAADSLSNATGLVIIVVVGLAVGFRPHSVPGLLVGFAVLLAFTLATSFLFALVGLYASSSQAVNAATFPVIFPLTFASSAFVPTATMPSWLRVFANHQPVTTVINTVRDLTLGNVTAAQRHLLFAGQSTTAAHRAVAGVDARDRVGLRLPRGAPVQLDDLLGGPSPVSVGPWCPALAWGCSVVGC